MTVDQLMEKLKRIAAKGHGARPVKVMQVEDGVTFALPITDCYSAERYDGKLVWLEASEIELPEWAK